MCCGRRRQLASRRSPHLRVRSVAIGTTGQDLPVEDSSGCRGLSAACLDGEDVNPAFGGPRFSLELPVAWHGVVVERWRGKSRSPLARGRPMARPIPAASGRRHAGAPACADDPACRQARWHELGSGLHSDGSMAIAADFQHRGSTQGSLQDTRGSRVRPAASRISTTYGAAPSGGFRPLVSDQPRRRPARRSQIAADDRFVNDHHVREMPLHVGLPRGVRFDGLRRCRSQRPDAAGGAGDE